MLRLFAIAAALFAFCGTTVTRGDESAAFRIAAGGFWTNCWGWPESNRVIVAPNARDAKSCHSAIMKCNGNVAIATQFRTSAVLQPDNVTVTLCNLSN